MSLKLSDIIPNESLLSDYYRYTGSLTSPPCTEGVIWNVFPQKINISLNQVCLFGVFFLNTVHLIIAEGNQIECGDLSHQEVSK